MERASESEGKRFETREGVYVVRGGRRYWVECSGEKLRELALDGATKA